MATLGAAGTATVVATHTATVVAMATVVATHTATVVAMATVVATHTATSAGVAKGAGAATNTVSQARLCHLQIMMYNYFENKIPKKTGLLRAIGPIVFCCGVEWKAL